MRHMRLTDWQKLPVSLTELCIDTTLRCGQSFRWRKSEEGEWSCSLNGRVLSLRQEQECLHYRAIFPVAAESLGAATTPLTPPPSVASTSTEPVLQDDEGTTALVKHYFNLAPNLTDLYEQWSSADANFKKKAPKFTGVRILRQDAWEALVGFICSSNNNIARISQMVEKLCIHYGPYLGDFDSKPYYDFPAPQALTGKGVEQHLRELGFGYRAKYLYQTALMVAGKEGDWLDNLRNPESPLLGQLAKPAGNMPEGGREGYRKAHGELLALQGVGPKVADCVCLMGLGWGEAVPVDTHVWQIAQRDYKFGKGKHSSLTKATYDAVGDKFRSLWGKEAGWAHSVLFTADLRAFSERLVAKIEVKEEFQDVKAELEGAAAEVETVVKSESVEQKRVKRESQEERSIVKVEEVVVKKSGGRPPGKRRRRA
ncbi:DNA glycosylase [Cryomyces antarcticus]